VNVAVTADDLVRVTSCLDGPRADLVQLALAREGIPSAFGNARFLSWFWHYSNAVGGVTVLVRKRDAEQAREVLLTAGAKPSVSLRAWVCRSCGQRIAGQWDACWQCGHLADGTPASPTVEDAAVQPAGDAEVGTRQNLSKLLTVAGGVLLVVLLFKYGWQPPLILAPFVAILYFLLRQFEPSSAGEFQPAESAEPGNGSSRNLSTTHSELSKAVVRRAWQAAVIAAFSFPPLGFYSMRLLWKLGQRDTPLSRADTWRCWTAFFLNIMTILFCLAFAGGVVFAFLRLFVPANGTW
jgi:hypothetical protein